MKSLGLVGLVVAVLAATAIASPWVAWALAEAGRPYTFARVYDRVFEVLLVVGVLGCWRRLGLGRARDVGFRSSGWARDLGRGFAAGLVGLAVGLALAWLVGGAVPALRYPPGKTVWKALLGLGAAGLIGVGEEALFRGVLLRRFRRDAGPALGVAVTTLVYAAVHVIRTRGSDGPVHVWSGVEQTLRLFAPLASGAVLPQVAGLALLGALLAAARLRSGALWLPIGIHAAFVATFRVGRLFFALRPTPVWVMGPGWPPLIGGAAGWVAVAVAAAYALRRRGARSRFVLEKPPTGMV
ncbi:MAG TPA: type II CAAX endopeptidase family protein [Candidatus Binatia bacterium]|nr:type II CAAX endopeptidase family protein [Candidatus Binatia bacterium]